MEVEGMAARWSGGGSSGGTRAAAMTAAMAWGQRRCGDNDEVSVAGARRGGGGGGVTEACGGGGGSGEVWTPSLAFLEQPLERESTPFFLQMMARVCGGVSSPLIEPIMGREGKGPT